jgi:hypothetical protein
MRRRFCFSLWRPLVVLALVIAGLRAAQPTHRYLFLDPAFVTDAHGTALQVQPPQRRETVIVPDRPWEQRMISFFLTVREDEGKLRMWYICRDKENHPNLAYAESIDGVHWKKPELGIADYEGSRANNLVGVPSLEGTPFIDPNAPASERYSYITHMAASIVRFHSADGLHWTRDAKPLLPFFSDTQNVTFWDDVRKRYVIYLRGWTPKYRTVVRFETASITVPSDIGVSAPGRKRPFIFDEMPTVLACDAQDPPRTDIYNMSAQPYAPDPSWYVAFPAYLRRSVATNADDYHGSHHGPVEIEFAGSRDGIAWHRYDRAAYATPGTASPEKKNMVFMGTGLVYRGDEIWQYGTEFESEHGDVAARERKTDGVIVRYVQRLDGFVALTAGNVEGTCRTGTVRISGNRLLLNVDTGALGELRVGLVGADGKPIRGYGLDACAPVQANATGVAVTWSGGDLARLQNQDVRLDLKLRRTRLFSLRFE